MDQTQTEFENWLFQVWEWFQDVVRQDPARFKVVRHPTFDQFIVVPSRNPEEYPPELRTKLSIRRGPGGIDDVEITTTLTTPKHEQVVPSQIWSGSMMTPIFKLGYYKVGDDFGLSLTVLKAEVDLNVKPQIPNDAWIIDENTSGSEEVASSSST